MNLNSRILGSSEKKLVILHGFLGSLDNWITIGRKLEQLNLEVHLVDLRNHGKSFHSKDFSYDYMCLYADFLPDSYMSQIPRHHVFRLPAF